MPEHTKFVDQLRGFIGQKASERTLEALAVLELIVEPAGDGAHGIRDQVSGTVC